MAKITIDNLKKSYGETVVIPTLDLEIPHGEFAVFVGPSGCGKSTLLRIIAGLEEIDHGEIYFDTNRVDQLSPAERKISMVFQSYALYPHMTVRENMSFGMKVAGAGPEETAARVERASEMLKLDQLLERYPRQLSGGQRQRVAIGRAITRDPSVFLFDEPLSNLDAALRLDMRIEIAKLKESLPDVTMIYVTHDQVEAMTLADRIVVFNDGRIEQSGTPLELYHRPMTKFVASFLGSPPMNFLNGRLEILGRKPALVLANGSTFDLRSEMSEDLIGEEVSVGVRAEHLSLEGASGALGSGHVRHVENLGEHVLIYVDLGEGASVTVKVPPQEVSKGSEVSLYANIQNLHLFDSHANRITEIFTTDENFSFNN